MQFANRLAPVLMIAVGLPLEQARLNAPHLSLLRAA